MLRPVDDAHIPAPARSLKTQHFPHHMNLFKQYCHPHTLNDIRHLKVVLRSRELSGNSQPKLKQLELLRGIFLWCALLGLGTSEFSSASYSQCFYPKIRQHLSVSINGVACVQGCCSPNACQSKWWRSLLLLLLLTINIFATNCCIMCSHW